MDASASVWPAILDPDWTPPSGWNGPAAQAAARRLADLVSPALAGYFLEPVAERTGAAPLPAETIRQSRLLNRFAGGIQRKWAAEIADTGISVVFLKGFVFAHTVYPDPDIRTIGDIDLLVRDRDLGALVAFLQERGFVFEDQPSAPWGFISDASYQPLRSADGHCYIDVHVQPDCYPAYRSLTADRLFAASEVFMAGETALAGPSPAHALVLCLTNAAKDKFGPFSVRKMLDIAALLRAGVEIDWAEVAMLASAGHFAGPSRVAFALLIRLGLPANRIPHGLREPPRGLRAAVFEGLARDYRTLFWAEPGPLRVLARELCLCTEPDVALHNALLRARGLFAPRRGRPPGHRADP